MAMKVFFVHIRLFFCIDLNEGVFEVAVERQ